MKHLLLAFLLPTALLAQVPQPVPQPQPRLLQPTVVSQASNALPDNYQITLNITDKDGQPLEVSMVVASTQFVAEVGDQHLTFRGSVTPEESGGFVIAYSLGWEVQMPAENGAVQFRMSAMQGSVRLKLGEEIQIIRTGPRVARLSIKKVEPSKSK